MAKMLDMLRAMDAYVGDQDDGGAVNEPVDNLIERDCQIAGCEEAGYTRCVCCNRTVCWYDIGGTDETVPGICSDCLFKCAGGMACQVVSHE